MTLKKELPVLTDENFDTIDYGKYEPAIRMVAMTKFDRLFGAWKKIQGVDENSNKYANEDQRMFFEEVIPTFKDRFVMAQAEVGERAKAETEKLKRQAMVMASLKK